MYLPKGMVRERQLMFKSQAHKSFGGSGLALVDLTRLGADGEHSVGGQPWKQVLH